MCVGINNYQTISLVLELALTYIVQKLHGVINQKQEAELALTYIVQQLHGVIDQKQEARLICFDISISFDRMLHRGLTDKLESICCYAG